MSEITDTTATCSSFSSGTAPSLSSEQYSVSKGTIKQTNPGGFFYWVKVTAAKGSNTFVINQSITTGNFNTLFSTASGSTVFNSSCTNAKATFTQSSTTNTATGTVTVTFTAPSAGTYLISVKFNAQSVDGKTVPSPSTVGYSFSTSGVAGSTQGLNLVKK